MKNFWLKRYIKTLSDAEKVNICAADYASSVRDAKLKDAIAFSLDDVEIISLDDATFLAINSIAKKAPNLPN